ncbi:MAG: response regulator transcription factor [Chloroflexota bacterium]
MYLLVVEDDASVARVVKRALVDAGERVDVVGTGLEGAARAETGAYDVIILDVMLPDVDGFLVCRSLRKGRVHTPIVLLTARDSVPDRVNGLDAGADDYLVKPFAVEELLARIRAVTRRGPATADDQILRVGDLTLDLIHRTARRGEQEWALTAKEFDLLVFLMRHPGHVLTKQQIFDHVWGYYSAAASNVVETYIHYLREKIDHGFARPLLRTIRGIGYTIKE